VRKGIELDSTTTQAALTLNLRHIKVGLKLIHSVCSFSNFLANEVLEIKLDENGTTVQHKLFQLLTDNRNDTPLIQNLILKAFDATITTIRGNEYFEIMSCPRYCVLYSICFHGFHVIRLHGFYG